MKKVLIVMVCLVISSPAVALDQAGIEWEKKHQIVYDVKAALINCNLLWDRTITKGERINEASMFCNLPTNETLNVPFDKEKLTVGTSYSKTTPFDIEQYMFPNGKMWKKKDQTNYDVRSVLMSCNLIFDRTSTKGKKANKASLLCQLPTNETLDVPFDREKLTVETNYSKKVPFNLEYFMTLHGGSVD